MNNPEPIYKDLVEKNIRKFAENEKDKEETLKMLFREYRDNSDISGVMIKTAVLNCLYSAGVKNIYVPDVARNIYENHEELDELLNTGKREYKAYDLIAFVKKDGVNNAYSFASKYLSFSCPELYPVMDRYSRELIDQYTEYYPEIPKIQNKNSYKEFCAAFDVFHGIVNRRTGDVYSAKRVDMFIWQYAKDLNT